jgi:hypothetical protein
MRTGTSLPGILDDDFYTLYGGCGKQQQAGNRPHPAGEIDSETTGLVGKRTSRLFQKGNDSMKRSCKEIDITDWQTDYPWVLACILKHRKRHDFRMLLCKIGGMQKRDYYTALQEADKSAFEEPARNIAKEAARRIAKRRLDLKPVQIREKGGPVVGKSKADRKRICYAAGAGLHRKGSGGRNLEAAYCAAAGFQCGRTRPDIRRKDDTELDTGRQPGGALGEDERTEVFQKMQILCEAGCEEMLSVHAR